jgi:hypothetical protein
VPTPVHALSQISRSLGFPEYTIPPSPTIDDVMKAINQLHRNQAQLLKAIDALQYSVNQVMANQTWAQMGQNCVLGAIFPNSTQYILGQCNFTLQFPSGPGS